MDSKTYSFKKLHDRNGIFTYYTKPSTINKYQSAEEILEDYHTILNHLGNNKWSWIIDTDGFEIKYALERKTGMDFAKLITGIHGDNLQEIKIINPTICIRMILTMALPFFNEATRKKINVLTDRYYSLLEFI